MKADPRWTPALVGAAPALADDDPPQAVALAKKALEINPSSVDALRVPGESGDRRRQAERGPASCWQKALAINPSSLDAHSLLAAMAYVEDKQPEFEAEVAKTLAIAPNYGEVYRVAGQLVANNYRFDEAVALTRRALALDPDNRRALTDLGTHLLRTGDEAEARAVLERSFKLHPYSVVAFNLLGMMDKLDTFETIVDGDYIFRMPKAEVAGSSGVHHSAHSQGGRRVLEAISVHAQGPNSHRGLRQARRLRGANGGPAGNGRRTRRLLRPGRDDGLAEGAAAGQLPVGGHAVARDWRTSITLQMSNQRVPRWLSEGISAFEEKRARPEWARPNDLEYRHAAQSRRDDQAARAERRVHRPADDLAGVLPGGAARRAPRRVVRRRRAWPSWCASYAQGIDTDEALKAALDTDFDKLQASFDQFNDRVFAQAAAGAARPPPRTRSCRACRCIALRAFASENPQSFIGQMALGRALLKEEQLDEAVQAFERAAALVPVARGAASPHAQLAAIAMEKNDRPRAIAELQTLMAVDFDNIEAARQLATLLREDRRQRSGDAPAGVRAHRGDRSLRRRRAQHAWPAGDAAQRTRDRRARVPRRHRARAGGPCRGADRSGGELPEGAGRQPRRRRKRWPRSKSRRATSARRACCSSSSPLAPDIRIDDWE